jgi:hypothetical protein
MSNGDVEKKEHEGGFKVRLSRIKKIKLSTTLFTEKIEKTISCQSRKEDTAGIKGSQRVEKERQQDTFRNPDINAPFMKIWACMAVKGSAQTYKSAEISRKECRRYS